MKSSDPFNTMLDGIKSPTSVAIADRVRELTDEGNKIMRLQTGEPYFDTPRYIIDGTYQAMIAGMTHYSNSQGLPELRKAISEWYEDDYTVQVRPQEIMIFCGAVHALYCTLVAILNPGDEVVIPEPFWPQYGDISNISGAKVQRIDTSSDDGRLTLSAFENAISPKTKVLIISNPSNPSGLVYSEAEMEGFLELALKHDIFVLVDEVYSRLTYTDKFCSVFSLPNYKRYKENILYLNSFSKTFAMTGWRVGFAILPAVLIPKVLLISQNTITHVNSFCQVGAKVALEGRKENAAVFDNMLAVYKERYNKLIKLLTEKKVIFLHPEGAFYFFIHCGQSSTEFALNLLNKENIAVVPGSAYGEGFDQYYRMSYAVDQDSFDGFVEWISKC